MKTVIVVGGGVSGLTAAKRLVDSGKFEVTLLEGEQRVGGRVQTKQLGDYFIENGAQFVHGEKGNAVFELINLMNLFEDGEESEEDNYFSGTLMVTNTGKVVGKELQGRYGPVAMKILNGPGDNEVEGSVGEWATKIFEKEFGGSSDSEANSLNAAALDWIQRTSNADMAADNWFQASLRNLHEYQKCEGNDAVVWKSPYSYSSFLNVIVNGSPSTAPKFQPDLPGWIQTGKEVTKIAQGNDSVTVQCSDRSQYQADHVIFTASLGVLKHSHKSLFEPPLPEKKAKAIEHLAIGVVDKLHFDFKKKWWPDDVYGFTLLWEDSGSGKEYWRSDIDEATLKEEIGGFPLWTRNIIGFYAVSSHPTALNSWVSGPAAKVMEAMTDDEVKNIFIKLLRHFLSGKHEVPDPVEFCRSTWATNKFIRGSYSFRQMASEANNVWHADIAEPILNKSNSPLICFAGEATNDHHYATVHGAYESGIREADRLINLP